MRKVLVIDDEPSICQLLKDALSDEFDVSIAEDGLEAMADILKDRPDVVIVDYHMNMPHLHGISIVEHIRSNPDNQSIRFILISGYLEPQQLKRWKELIGDAVFFSKPFDIPAITTTVRQLCAARK